MPTSEICNLTATEMVQMISRKEVSAREIMEAHLTQIDRVNPKVNALVTLCPELALEGSDLADKHIRDGDRLGILHGLPVAHKDLFPTKGIRTTFGSPIFSDHVPDYNCLIVERLQSSGAITIGKTNTPEFGLGSQSYNSIFGATGCAYEPARTSGGS